MFQPLNKSFFLCLALFPAFVLLPACSTKSKSPRIAKASGSSGGESGPGNGGAAIRRNGQLLTIGQAGVMLEDTPPLTTIPGLTEALDLANRLLLPERTKGALQRALRPQRGYRNYFNIQRSEMTPEKYAELISEYQKNIAVVPDEIEIVALTSGNETYFFPGFYELSDQKAQAAILFHEALWAMNPNLSYRSVIKTEVAMEKIMRSGPLPEKIYDIDLMQAIKDGFADPYLGLTAAALYDFSVNKPILRLPDNLRSFGALERQLDSPVFRLVELIGPEALEALQSEYRLNVDLVYAYMLKLKALNPDLKLIDELFIELDNLEVAKVTDTGKSAYFINATSAASRWQINASYGLEEFDFSKPYARLEGWDIESFHGLWTGSPGTKVRITGMRGKGGSIGHSATSTQKNWDMLLYLANHPDTGCSAPAETRQPQCVLGRKFRNSF